MNLRNYIRNKAQLNGADFRKDLTKQVTHLIARTAGGEKYKYATQWNVKVVTLKWFTDSMERGMILEETLYHPLLPEEQQGVGAWKRSLPAVKPKPQETESSSGARPRKLRRIASVKLGDQNENIWGDIIGTGFETAEPRPSREERQAANEQKQKKASAVQIFKSFASEITFAPLSQTREPTAEPVVDRRNGFLDGCFFLIHGFTSKQVRPVYFCDFAFLIFLDECITESPFVQWRSVGGFSQRVLSPRHTKERSWSLHHCALQNPTI